MPRAQIEEMTVRELISERSRGIPMQSALHGKRKRGEAAQSRRGSRPGMTEEERMAEEDAEVVANGPQLAGDDGTFAPDDDGYDDEVLSEADQPEMDGQVDEGSDEEDASEAAAESEQPAFAPQLTLGPDGQLVLDEASLQVTASGSGASAAAMGAGVEDDGAPVTSCSYLNRSAAVPWGKDETERFYSALRK